ncbi:MULTISPECIES: type VII secretion target [Kitasatospora]|uniref:type VII secretion target n=1 Tax=Kitasatospora TaxID=2063 RepID=UPI000C70CC2F|nr:type VII secretion target [Kitasatospora sp. GP30]MDH6143592.1 uncharacterized protein YukE [Kitasatospora sp. GP30]
MAADHFHIEPAKVVALSADFSSSATSLDGQVTTFAAKGENVNDAFGVMAESVDALQKYVAMTQATVTSLRQLQTQLQGYSDTLTAAVVAYQNTDRQHAKNLGA